MLGKTNSLLDSAPPRQITLTLEGAKEDTITVTDSSGNTIGSCVFSSGQTTGDITIPITDGQSYTFTSSVAKDTTSGTSNYSKSVVLTSGTTSVKVMPDGALYWYGNECTDKSGGWSTVAAVSNSSYDSNAHPYAPVVSNPTINSRKVITDATYNYSGVGGLFYTNNRFDFDSNTTAKINVLNSSNGGYNYSSVAILLVPNAVNKFTNQIGTVIAYKSSSDVANTGILSVSRSDGLSSQVAIYAYRDYRIIDSTKQPYATFSAIWLE